jgi:hypothetical protein
MYLLNFGQYLYLKANFQCYYIGAIIFQNLSIYCYLINYKYLLKICYFNHYYPKFLGIVFLVLIYHLLNIIEKSYIINQLLIIFNLFIIAMYSSFIPNLYFFIFFLIIYIHYYLFLKFIYFKFRININYRSFPIFFY